MQGPQDYYQGQASYPQSQAPTQAYYGRAPYPMPNYPAAPQQTGYLQQSGRFDQSGLYYPPGEEPQAYAVAYPYPHAPAQMPSPMGRSYEQSLREYEARAYAEYQQRQQEAYLQQQEAAAAYYRQQQEAEAAYYRQQQEEVAYYRAQQPVYPVEGQDYYAEAGQSEGYYQTMPQQPMGYYHPRPVYQPQPMQPQYVRYQGQPLQPERVSYPYTPVRPYSPVSQFVPQTVEDSPEKEEFSDEEATVTESPIDSPDGLLSDDVYARVLEVPEDELFNSNPALAEELASGIDGLTLQEAKKEVDFEKSLKEYSQHVKQSASDDSGIYSRRCNPHSRNSFKYWDYAMRHHPPKELLENLPELKHVTELRDGNPSYKFPCFITTLDTENSHGRFKDQKNILELTLENGSPNHLFLRDEQRANMENAYGAKAAEISDLSRDVHYPTLGAMMRKTEGQGKRAKDNSMVSFKSQEYGVEIKAQKKES